MWEVLFPMQDGFFPVPLPAGLSDPWQITGQGKRLIWWCFLVITCIPGAAPLVMDRGCWETPLGNLPIHGQFASNFAKEIGATPLGPDTFPDENTIELQLPFVKYFFPNAAIVPVGVPPSSFAGKIGITAVEVAVKLGLAIKVIGSTDMTHYGPNYNFTPQGKGRAALDWVKNINDQEAVKAMVKMDVDAVVSQGLKNHNLCCPGAVAAAIAASRAMGADKGIMLDYTTSHEKSPGDSFVGYSGVVFEG